MSATRFPPRPSVEHLVTIFRRIDAKNILIPAFQRTFVWREAQILALLESVYNGFPIGSILLWRVERPILKISDADEVPFPKGSPDYPADFVLDGLQRLSTLYGVFHFGSATHNQKFNVVFNLTEKRFEHRNEDEPSDNHLVPLNALFNPRALLDVQQKLFSSSKGDELVESVLTLQSRFQEYMIPLVTLSNREADEVVSIFERVNSTGTPLSRVDFMRAITWSSNFDLNDALDTIGDELRDIDFDIADDTIVKAIGLTFDLDPLPDVMLKLRDKQAGELASAAKVTLKTFLRTIAFLQEELHILSSDFVPYEGQLLALFRIFYERGALDDNSKSLLEKWFFSVSLSESLQGRPDHYVARLIRRLASNMEEEIKKAQRSSIWELGYKRLIRGKALSSAFVTLLAREGARSLVDGRIIPFEEYLRSFDTASFVPIFSKEHMAVGVSSSKIISNVVLIPPTDSHVLRTETAQSLLKRWYRTNSDMARLVLESQLLPASAQEELFEMDASQFFMERSELIEYEAMQLIQ